MANKTLFKSPFGNLMLLADQIPWFALAQGVSVFAQNSFRFVESALRHTKRKR